MSEWSAAPWPCRVGPLCAPRAPDRSEVPRLERLSVDLAAPRAPGPGLYVLGRRRLRRGTSVAEPNTRPTCPGSATLLQPQRISRYQKQTRRREAVQGALAHSQLQPWPTTSDRNRCLCARQLTTAPITSLTTSTCTALPSAAAYPTRRACSHAVLWPMLVGPTSAALTPASHS